MRSLTPLTLITLSLCLSAGAQASPLGDALVLQGFTATQAVDRVEAANRKNSKRVGGKNSKGKGGKYVGGKPGKK
jgi:hypothetical protein